MESRALLRIAAPSALMLLLFVAEALAWPLAVRLALVVTSALAWCVVAWRALPSKSETKVLHDHGYLGPGGPGVSVSSQVFQITRAP